MDRLAALDVFVRVVDTGSFSAAARHHRVGQPAASKAVGQLEDWLGVALLIRSTRRVVPTEAGRSFYADAKRLLETADDAVIAARGMASSLNGTLRISAAVCLARLHLIPQLPTFLAQHPGLDVEFVLDDRVVDLAHEGIDVALRTSATPDPTMTVRKIAEARRIVVATPAYFARHGMPRTPDDLAAHRAVIYTRDGGGRNWSFRHQGETCPVSLRGRFMVSASEGVRSAVLADLGLTVISEWSFTPELHSGAVVAALEDWELPRLDLSAVLPAGRRASPKARAFIAFAERCFAEYGLSQAESCNVPNGASGSALKLGDADRS